MIKNYYKILEIDQNATLSEIRSSFRKLATFWHPDKNSNPLALEKMKELNEAYNILSNNEKRNVYNRIYNSFFPSEIVLRYDETETERHSNFEKDEKIKEKFKEDYEKLSQWIINTDFSLKNIDRLIEQSISIVDKPIENFAYYFPFIFIIIIIIIIISAIT